MIKSTKERGASEVLGNLLIIGISLILSVSFAVGFQGYSQVLTDSVDETTAKSNIIEFNSDIQDTTQSPSSIPIQTDLENSFSVQKSSLKVIQRTDSTTTILTEQSYDTLRYDAPKSTIYIENGGIWKERDGNTVLVSNPLFSYDNGVFTANLFSSNSAERINPQFGSIQRSDTTSTTGSNSYSANTTYEIQIESPVYRQIGEYMKTKYTNGVNITYNDTEDQVQITVNPKTQYKKSTDSTIYTVQNIINNGNITGLTRTGTYTGSGSTSQLTQNTYIKPNSIQDEITTEISSINANSPSEPTPGSGTVTSGQYYVDSDVTLSDVSYDTSEGPIEIGVEGDLQIDSGSTVSITDDSNPVKFYIEGDVNFDSSSSRSVINSSASASQLQIFSSTDDIILNNVDYTGIIYNTSNSEQKTLTDTNDGSLCTQSTTCLESTDYTGSLITQSLYINNSSSLSYDSSVESITFDFLPTETEDNFEYNITNYLLEYS